MKKIIALLALILLGGCSDDPMDTLYMKNQEITEESVKSISSQITSAYVNKQYAGPYKGLTNISIPIKSDTSFGAAQSWNGAALTIFNLCRTLLLKDGIGKITFIVSDENNLQWANIEVSKDMLPSNWNELTYLEFFSYINPICNGPESEQWLTEFYSKYSSAVPQ